MIKLYRIPLRLASPLASELKGDTIWGHVVWGIANHEDDDAVRDFLEKCKGEEPPLVVSSAFPAGFVCKDLPVPEKREASLSLEEYAKIKKKKKMRHRDASNLLDAATPPAGDGKNESPAGFEVRSAMRNTINRLTGTVVEDGGLYSVRELWSKSPRFDVYAASTLEPERLRKLFTWAFENGFGADASVGKGRVELDGEIKEVSAKKSGKRYMALGPFVLKDENEAPDLRADIFIRAGKVGGAFAASLSPYKKTVALFDEGAVFSSAKEIAFIGSLIERVHSGDERICQSGFAPVIPLGD